MILNKFSAFLFKGSIRIYLILLVISLQGCVLKPVSRFKNITYNKSNTSKKLSSQQLNVFAPKKLKSLSPVIVFIHGGNWNSGHKEQYNFFGNNWARKNVVTVIIDYPLSPYADYKDMAAASAEAVKWVHDSIKNYGGDPAKIFIAGHSAGGHLATLISLQDKYFDKLNIKNPIQGVISIDAAGHDMFNYLLQNNFKPGHSYLETFTNDTSAWRDASLLYQLHKNMPPIIFYMGGKTYPSIKAGSEKFLVALEKYDRFEYHFLKRKKHIPMITQFIFPWNKRYKEIKAFMERK